MANAKVISMARGGNDSGPAGSLVQRSYPSVKRPENYENVGVFVVLKNRLTVFTEFHAISRIDLRKMQVWVSQARNLRRRLMWYCGSTLIVGFDLVEPIGIHSMQAHRNRGPICPAGPGHRQNDGSNLAAAMDFSRTNRFSITDSLLSLTA